MTTLNRRGFLVSLLVAPFLLLNRSLLPPSAHAYLFKLWQEFIRREGTMPKRIGVSPTMFQQYRDEISGWSAPVRMDMPDIGHSVPSSRLMFKSAVVSIGLGLTGTDYTIGA